MLQVCTSLLRTSLSWGVNRWGWGADDISPSIYYIHLVLLEWLLQKVTWFTRPCFLYCPPCAQYGQVSTSRDEALCFYCLWLIGHVVWAQNAHPLSWHRRSACPPISLFSLLVCFHSSFHSYLYTFFNSNCPLTWILCNIPPVFIIFGLSLLLHSQYLLSSSSFPAICWYWRWFLHMVAQKPPCIYGLNMISSKTHRTTHPEDPLNQIIPKTTENAHTHAPTHTCTHTVITHQYI